RRADAKHTREGCPRQTIVRAKMYVLDKEIFFSDETSLVTSEKILRNSRDSFIIFQSTSSNKSLVLNKAKLDTTASLFS
ncbi:hypothetical protein ACUWCL_29140, partial [Klebsiella pneumoniae]|uniref:hypothetical protein n=1 Tax=Klebsiella pneumoniae TaxID=573 RepID=UPI0040556723